MCNFHLPPQVLNRHVKHKYAQMFEKFDYENISFYFFPTSHVVAYTTMKDKNMPIIMISPSQAAVYLKNVTFMNSEIPILVAGSNMSPKVSPVYTH